MITKSEHSASEVLIAMKNGLLMMVHCYNVVGLYEHAQHAQTLALAVHRFEADHNLTQMGWPPQVVDGDEGTRVADLHGEPIDNEEL